MTVDELEGLLVSAAVRAIFRRVADMRERAKAGVTTIEAHGRQVVRVSPEAATLNRIADDLEQIAWGLSMNDAKEEGA